MVIIPTVHNLYVINVITIISLTLNLFVLRIVSLAWNETTNVPIENSGPFEIGTENGFLPIHFPIATLPDRYSALEKLVQEIPYVKKDGSPGLLAEQEMEEALKGLPLIDYSNETEYTLLAALFRDYAFIASAYIFEHSQFEKLTTGSNGLARDRLPSNIAIPLVQLAKKLKAPPMLDYAHAYVLNNWKKVDMQRALDFDNIEPIRTFTGSGSEIGFIRIFVSLQKFSGILVESALNLLRSIEDENEEDSIESVECILDTLRHFNRESVKVLSRTSHKDLYLYKVFLSGTKNRLLTPNGVVYEGVSEEPVVMEILATPSSDSIIPLIDNLFELSGQWPIELTDILQQLDSNRPQPHSRFLKWVQEKSRSLNTKTFLINKNPLLYLRLLEQVQEFRERHWNFLRMYVFRQAKFKGANILAALIRLVPKFVFSVHNQVLDALKVLKDKDEQLSQHEVVYCSWMSNTTILAIDNLKEEVEALAIKFNISDVVRH